MQRKELEQSPRDTCRTCCARQHHTPARSHALEPPTGRRSKGAIEACICHLHFRAPELKIARFLRSRDASGWTALFKFNKYIACAHTMLLWQHTAHVHTLSLHCRGQRTPLHEHKIIIEASFRIFKARCAAGARGSCMQQCMQRAGSRTRHAVHSSGSGRRGCPRANRRRLHRRRRLRRRRRRRRRLQRLLRRRRRCCWRSWRLRRRLRRR